MKDCVFCKIIKEEIPAKKIYEDDVVIAIMDINPIVDGHVLIIPKEHFEDFQSIKDDVLLHVYEVARKLSKELISKLNKTGITLLVNQGYTLVNHFHMHLLPDYETPKREKTVDEVYDILK